MASNQPSNHQLEAAAAYVKHYLTEQQVAATQMPPAPAPAQYLNQYLGGNGGQLPQTAVAVQPPLPQASLSRLVADYLKASHQQGPGPVPTLPPNLWANFQAQVSAAAAAPVVPPHQIAPLPPHQIALPPVPLHAAMSLAPNNVNAAHAQQQLLASAQLLSAVNPGLAAAAMAQALTMANATNSASKMHDVHTAPTPPLALGAVAAAPLTFSTNNNLGQPSSSVLAPQHQMQHQAAVAQSSHQMSAGVAAAQYRQQLHNMNQHAQRPSSVGATTVHSNRSSPGMSATSSHQQVHRPTSEPTKPEVLHQVSSGSSINTGSINKTTSTQAKSAAGAASSRKNQSPTTPEQQSQSSITASASSGSGGTILSSGGTILSTNTSGMQAAMASSAVGIHHHHGLHRKSAAVTAAAATSSAAASNSGALSSVQHIPIITLQRFSLEQLEAHVNELREAKQTVPQAVSLLLADTRRKEEKRHAKRLANRKSACTSRARKKALIEEMTKDNARLRRQALILSYLPDPVVAISTEGVITFCSMQVERVLKHNVSGLIGANIEDIIVPSSREAIRRLIQDLVIAEQRALSSSVEGGESNDRSEGDPNAGGESESNNSDRENVSAGPHPHEVSEHSSDQSFPPLLEVKVKAGLTTSTEVAAGEDVSDSSGDPLIKNCQVKSSDATTPTEMSSLTHKNSPSGDNSNDDQQSPPAAKKAKTSSANTTNSDENKKPSTTTTTTESDASTSSENKKASANLTKNVEMCKLNKDNKFAEEVRFSHKDDVMGASVTGNNAGAKLSSLMYHPKAMGSGGDSSAHAKQQPEQQDKTPKLMANGKQSEEQSASSADSSSRSKPRVKKQRSGNSSEDSGYRQSPEGSNEYTEDSFSSSAASLDRSSKKKQRRARPLAPACNVRLIRNDLSTIWCELTSSIRTRPPDDIYDKDFKLVTPKSNGSSNNNNNDGSNESVVSLEGLGQEEKELLLCFRPIREGDMAGEELRFCPEKVGESEKTTDGTSDDSPANSSFDDLKMPPSTNHSSSSNKDCANFKMAPSMKATSSNGVDSPSLAETQAAATAPSTSTSLVKKNRPPKKRKFEIEEDKQPTRNKKCCGDKRYSMDDTQVDKPDEKSAIESMMELAKNPL